MLRSDRIATIEIHNPSYATADGVTNGTPFGAVYMYDLWVETGCAGDADGDFVVSFRDITEILRHFGTVYAAGQTGLGDSNANGTVDMNDVYVSLRTFNHVCPR